MRRPPLEEGARFCVKCGAAQSAAAAHGAPTARQPKKKKSTGKIITSVICLLLSAVILVTCFWQPGFLVKSRDKGIESGGHGIGIDPTATGRVETGQVTAENLTVETEEGVTCEISPFLLSYNEELDVSVRRAGVETADNGDWRITAYDVEIGDLKELGTFIDIRLPFDGSFCDEGEDPAECVGAKYFNETTGEWEDVLYDVDAENMEVVIHTDHLSRYGCFEVASAGYRKAYITSIDEYADELDISLEEATAALSEYTQLGEPGESCKSIGMKVLNGVVDGTLSTASTVGDQLDLVSNTYSGLNLGDIQFFTERNNEINKSIGESLGNLGKILGAVKLGAEILKSNKTSDDIIGIYKDAGMYALSFAEGGLGYAMVGVWMIDKSLTDLGNEAKNIRMENWETIYQYFNDQWQDPVHGGAHRARTTAEWRDLIAKVITASHGDQDTFKALLEAQVDSYARRFFENEPEEDIEEIQHIVGHMWKGALSASEKEAIIKKYKDNLYDRLTSVIMVEMQKDYQNQVKSQMHKELKVLKNLLNSETSVHIYEELEDGVQPHYAGYKIRFGKLSSDAKVESWTGVMNKKGEANTKISLIGWIAAGQPDHVDFWAPDKDPDVDKPEFFVDFEFDVPSVDVVIKSGFPTFEEVLGDYENGIMTIVDIYVPPEIEDEVEAAEEGCDIDLKQMIGETSEEPFSIVQVGENTATMSGEDLGMVYNDKTGKFGEVRIITEKEGEQVEIVMSGECSYSDEQRSGVIFGCEATMTFVSNDFAGVAITVRIAGEKPLS